MLVLMSLCFPPFPYNAIASSAYCSHRPNAISFPEAFNFQLHLPHSIHSSHSSTSKKELPQQLTFQCSSLACWNRRQWSWVVESDGVLFGDD